MPSQSEPLARRGGEIRSNLIGRIDLITLRLFVAIVEEASIAQAAEREHMAASAVSKRIGDLEQVLRVQLLERQRRGVLPTPAGQALVRHARTILNNLEQLESEISEYSNPSHGVRGHVRARANESALFGFFPDALSRFLTEYPQVTVDLQPDTSTGAVRAVRENATDLAIFWGDQPIDGLATFPCYVDRLVVAVPEGHPLVARRSVRFEQLLDYEIVEQEAFSSIQNVIERAAAQSGHRIRTRIRVAGFDAVCRMVQAGFGVGIVPDYFVAARRNDAHHRNRAGRTVGQPPAQDLRTRGSSDASGRQAARRLSDQLGFTLPHAVRRQPGRAQAQWPRGPALCHRGLRRKASQTRLRVKNRSI